MKEILKMIRVHLNVIPARKAIKHSRRIQINENIKKFNEYINAYISNGGRSFLFPIRGNDEIRFSVLDKIVKAGYQWEKINGELYKITW